MMNKILSFPYVKYRKTYYIVCIALIIISLLVGFIRGFNMGIDFTGGTMLQIDFGKEIAVAEIQDVMQTQELSGDIVHAGEGNHQVIIKTTTSLDTAARDSLIKAFTEKFGITEESVLSIENIGPSVGDSLKKNAMKAVAVAVLLMLIYIAVRFQWKYGVSAILALVNTILIVMGFYGVFGIAINSPFIAAILTILGYGINDTIVIFDRIRENVKFSGRKNVSQEIVDKSVQQTVGRSIMTSFTTVAVMIPLLIFCGSTVRSFILPLMIGVIVSTLSSIFIATSIWYDINSTTEKKTSKYPGAAKTAKVK